MIDPRQLIGCFILVYKLSINATDKITYDLACGIRFAADTTFCMMGEEIAKAFEVDLTKVEYLVVGPYKFKKYYISGVRLLSPIVIPAEIIEAFALGDCPRLIFK